MLMTPVLLEIGLTSMATVLNIPFSSHPKTLTSPPSQSSPLLRSAASFPLSYITKPARLRHSIIHGISRIISPSIPTTTELAILLQEFGLDDREAEALLRKHPPLEFAPPESIRHRLVSLQSVKITGLALHRAFAKRPEILTSAEIGPLLDFVREELEGLEPAKLVRLLLATHPVLFTGFRRRVRLLLDHEIPREKLVHVLNNVNIKKVFCERSVDEIVEMILFLKRYGWPDLILRRPVLLNLDLKGQMIPRIGFLTELAGGDEKAAGILIGKLPAILAYTVDHFKAQLGFWRSVGLTDDEVFKILMVYPNVFSISKERKLKPRVEFLKECGLSVGDIFKFLIKAPLFLSLSFEDNLSKKLGFLVKIGYKQRTRELALAMGATTRTSCENMQMVVGLFFSYGFSCEDVFAMSTKHPQVLQYNHASLEKKMEFLIEGMDREIGELLAFPAFLGYKLDDRIKSRYEEKKEVRGKWMSLNKLLSVSTERFYLKKNSTELEYDCDIDAVQS